MTKLGRFLRDWTLILAILAGILGYLIYISIPFNQSVHSFVNEAVGIVQPVFIFVMLYLTFCKVDLHDLKLKKWHIWILLLQALLFTGIGCVLIAIPHSGLRIILEGAMLCLICPTATAGAVITRKLGGSVSGITSYTILINIVTALLIPALVPFVHPNPGMNVWKSGLLILGKVFPLLLLPLVCGMLTRKYWPSMMRIIDKYPDASFYLWAISLALAIAVTTRSVMHAEIDLATELWLVAVSFVCCLFQFWMGRRIGRLYGDTITAGQSFGQKNTVLAIWMGYTFFTPVTAMVGGFYSLWHNIINSYQLYEHEHHRERFPDSM